MTDALIPEFAVLFQWPQNAAVDDRRDTLWTQSRSNGRKSSGSDALRRSAAFKTVPPNAYCILWREAEVYSYPERSRAAA